MTTGAASRTAVLVCQGRAAGDGLVPAFHDPVAVRLLDDEERVPVQQVLDRAPPQGWSRRVTYESVRASAEVMVPRAVEIDAALRARPCPQLVVLGAGLDDRAWRLPELADVDVYEVDHEASQRDKQRRASGLTPTSRSLHYVTVDFARDRLDVALAAAGHEAAVATSWLWEGVVPYLTVSAVTATVAAVAALSAPGSRLVVNYQSPSRWADVGRFAAKGMRRLARQPDLWASEPRRSAWTAESMRSLLSGHGFRVVSDVDLLTVAARLATPMTHRRSLGTGRVAVADLDETRRDEVGA